jgi:hypothetical protein
MPYQLPSTYFHSLPINWITACQRYYHSGVCHYALLLMRYLVEEPVASHWWLLNTTRIPKSSLTEVGPHAVPSTAVQTYSRPYPRMMGPIISVRLLEMWSRHHCALSRHIGPRGSFDIHRSSGTRPISTALATSRNANKPESPIQPTRFIAMHTALSFPYVTVGMVVFWHASRSSFITR